MPLEHPTTALPPTEDSAARALDAYLAAVEAGTAPPREQFLERHPQLADDLDACLAALRFIGRAAEAPRALAAGAAADPLPEAPPGQLGDYRLVREVGRGGMGVVYEAQQLSLRRRVALKLLPFAGALDARQLQRFKNEAQAAAYLQHPNIVPVYYVGCERGIHFYAMQFIDGQTLAQIIADLRLPIADLKQKWATDSPPKPGEATGPYTPEPTTESANGNGPPPIPFPTTTRGAISTEHSNNKAAFFRTVAELGIQAAEALEHAHQLGVIHRDIKPGNLLIDHSPLTAHHAPRLWVTDFGLAHMQTEASLTLSGDLLGTLKYMSPEQALAQRVIIDHRTDIYSLGATLYELLTLRPVFGGVDRQEILRRIAFEEPAAPRRLDRAIPAELETIVLKALEKNPADRYATATALAEDLRRFLDGKPIRAKRPTPIQWIKKWAHRHRAILTAAVASALVVLMFSIIYVTAAYNSEKHQRQEADQQKKHALNAKAEAETQRRKAERLLYDANMQLARTSLEAGNAYDMALELLETYRPQANSLDMRGWEWYFLQTLCRQNIFRTFPLIRNRATVWSPDLKRLACAWNSDGTIDVLDIANGQKQSTIRTINPRLQGVVWSPDGQLLATWETEGNVRVWNAATGKEQSRLDGNYKSVSNVAFSPDGRYLAANASPDDRAGDLVVWNLANRTKTFTVPESCYCLAWSSDGKYLASSGERPSGRTKWESGIKIWETGQWKEIMTLPIRRCPVKMAWSPKGYLLAWPGEHDMGRVWNITTRKEIGTFRGAYDVAWSPDGEKLVTGTFDKHYTKVLDARSGKELVALAGHNGLVNHVAWSRDGTRLASSGGGSIIIWNVKEELRSQKILEKSEGSEHVAWSPDGTKLAIGKRNGKIQIWPNSAPTNGVTLLPGHESLERVLAWELSWNPTGNILASSAEGLVKKGPPPLGPVVEPPSHRSEFKRWDVETGKPIASSDNGLNLASPKFGRKAAWSPDGRWLARLENPQTLLILESSSRPRQIKRLQADQMGDFGSVFWSANSRLLLVRKGGGLLLLKAESWAPLGTMDLRGIGGDTEKIVVSPEASKLAFDVQPHNARGYGGPAREIRIWDIAARKIAITLRGHLSGLASLAWHPDGQRLASASADGTIRIWDTTTGQEVFRLHEDAAFLAWSPGGRQLASVERAEPKRVKIWDASLGYTLPSWQP
jgi:WD40 repeat protein/serine/threonine protein kinase